MPLSVDNLQAGSQELLFSVMSRARRVVEMQLIPVWERTNYALRFS